MRSRLNVDTNADYEFPDAVKSFIAEFEPREDIKDLRDIISWNEKHAAQALPEREYHDFPQLPVQGTATLAHTKQHTRPKPSSMQA